MKTVILATLISIGASAAAYTVDYGPGSYTKTVKVCGYGRHRSSANDCQMNTYRFYAPRKETVCNKEGNGSKITCYDRVSTGNWGSRVFTSKAEAEAANREGNSKGGSSQGDNRGNN